DLRASVIYEAGNRMAVTLRDLAEAAGSDRPAALCRELTKIHEEIRRGSLAELAALVESGAVDGRGEFVIVLGESIADVIESDVDGAYLAALAAVEQRIAEGSSRSDAVRAIAAAWKLDRRRLWTLAHRDAAEGE
ncbi:MAG: 16S rRNA (cytidine(1402)-2'-O)-methyltransferase, partial [Candidatus Limnocylindrus sp.]